MWIRSKQCKRRKEMVGTRKRNVNLSHQEEIDKEARLILVFFKFLPKH
jgi:hypothetical protein